MIDYLKEHYKEIDVESLSDTFDFYKKLGFKKRRDQSDRIYPNTIDMHLKVKKHGK